MSRIFIKLHEITETYPGMTQTLKMESFKAKVKGFQALTIVANLSIIDFLKVLATSLN